MRTFRFGWLPSVAVVCSLLFGTARAAEPLLPRDIRQNLFSTCFLNDHEGWVVGELGRVLHTTDGGKTFTRSDTKTAKGLLAITCFPDRTVIVAGQLGLLMRSRDGGGTWETMSTGTKRSLLGVSFATRDVGVAVGDYGTLIRTEDGGTTWNRVHLPQEVFLPEEVAEVVDPGDVLLYDVDFATAERGWIVGEFGTIFTTFDAGRTWVSQKSPAQGTLFGVDFTDAEHGWAVGLESVMLRTTDGGATWTPEAVPVPKGFFLALYDVAVQGSFGWAVGDRGMLLNSTDGGVTWKRVQLPIRLAGNWFRGLSLTPAGTGAIVGNRGFMLVTDRDQFRELRGETDAGRRTAGEG